MLFRNITGAVQDWPNTNQFPTLDFSRYTLPLNKPVKAAGHQEKDIASLQIMRGVAAVAVAFYHTHVILSMPEYGGIETLASSANYGWLGVNFFFVLSGFIILFAHGKDIGNKNALGAYFWRRVARVYPIYWILLTLFILGAMKGLGSHGLEFSPRQLFSAYSLFAIMDAPPLPLKVAWTLFIEMKFYLVFSILILSRRVGTFILLLWAVAILGRNSFEPFPDFGMLAPDWGLLSIWNIYFLCGMLACLLINRIPTMFGPAILAMGVGLLAWTAAGAPLQEFAMRMPPLLTKYAMFFGLVILGAVLCERRYQWQMPKWSLLLGNASYSIYLIHSAVISVIAQLNFKLAHGMIPNLVVFAAAFTLAVTAGVIAHLAIETPILNMLRGQKVVRPTKVVEPVFVGISVWEMPAIAPKHG